MKRFLANAALVVVSVLLTAVMLEAGLRLVPNRFRMAFEAERDNHTTITYQSLDEGFYTLAPGQQAKRFQRACFDIAPLSTNDAGFRDHAWGTKTGFRTLVLGDSYVEALQVADGENTAARLRDLIPGEILSAGVSGYSTVTELDAYRRMLRRQRPDVVVLMFFLGNDVDGNSCQLQRMAGRPLCGSLRADGSVALTRAGTEAAPSAASDAAEAANPAAEGASDSGSRSKRWLRGSLVSYYVAHDLRMIAEGLIGQARAQVPVRWQFFRATETPAWHEAWAVTEEALRLLKHDVEEDGGKLLVVGIPEHFSTSRDWRRELMLSGGSGVPDDLDPARPARRLAAIGASLGLPVIDLLPILLRYRDAHSLDFPYFAFACDGHWNPLTHYLAAHEIAAVLAEKGILPGDSARLREAFARSPQDILGADAFGAIYRGGVYRGGARSGIKGGE